ncbi:hypothetical protein G4B88_006946 [Cannabis sativa]|uniref:Uncharacterized protein n=1 Tax=Cannabis sativa TaxID=3483 RepID=A0A7J6G3Y6_CANSA|nr:hypothetical protein G4B88_006946 [Cannabis sativa]
MASSSSKLGSHQPSRSISLPSRLNPKSQGIETQLNKLKTQCDFSFSSRETPIGSDTIQSSLTSLAELYASTKELIHSPLTQQALLQNHSRQTMEETLDTSIGLLDACCAARELLLGMKENVQSLQSALRRKVVGDSSIESNVQTYINFRKNARKEVSKSLKALKTMQKNNNLSSIHFVHDQPLQMVTKVLSELSNIAISIFGAMFVFLSMPKIINGWSLISKLMPLSSDKGHKIFNEVGSVDITLLSLQTQMRKNDTKIDVEIVQKRLESVDGCVNVFEARLDCLFRSSLVGLAELYSCVEELIASPSTQQALLAPTKHGKVVEQALESSITLLDTTNIARDLMVTMKEQVQSLQSAFRRKGRDSSIETSIQTYLCFRKKAKKDIAKCLGGLKRMETKSIVSQQQGLEDLSIVEKTLRETTSITISILKTLLKFILAIPTTTNGWSLLSKVVKMKSLSYNDQKEEKKNKKIVNLVESVDLFLHSLMKNIQSNEVEMSQRMLLDLDSSSEAIVVGLNTINPGDVVASVGLSVQQSTSSGREGYRTYKSLPVFTKTKKNPSLKIAKTKPNMAINKLSVRSISLPTRPHPTTTRIEQQLHKIQALEFEVATSSSSSFFKGLLFELEELYECVDDLLQMGSTQQVLSQNQHEKSLEDLLEASLRLLDLCGITRDVLLQTKQHVGALQSTLRRRKGDPIMEINITTYNCFRKKMKKEVKKLTFAMKQVSKKFESSQTQILSEENDHLCAVMRALRQVCAMNSSIFQSLFMYLIMTPNKVSKWSLVSKLVNKSSAVACEEKLLECGNELESVDIALSSLLCCNYDDLKLKIAQKRSEDLEMSIDGLENVRSHPTTQKVEQELNKINLIINKEISSSTTTSSSSLCNSLSSLKDLYGQLEDLLSLPLTRQALAQHQQHKWVNELVDDSLSYLDICHNTNDVVSMLKQNVKDLQSAIRRAKVLESDYDDHSSIETSVSAYFALRKKMKKSSNIFGQLVTKNCNFPLNLDTHLSAVVRVLRETSLVTSSILGSLSLFLSTPLWKPKTSRWSLVSIMVQKGYYGNNHHHHHHVMNEFEGLDMAMNGLLSCDENGNDEKIEDVLKKLEALEVAMEGLENGLEGLFRLFLHNRVCLLNKKNILYSAMTVDTKKIMKFGLSLFRRGFNSSKCKTAAKMAVARIKLLKNKRQVVVKQMRRDIALLLQSGQDATARIRVEHVMREQNILAANEFIELFCELIVSRLSIIAKQRECPADLKEGISSLIFAAPRCSEIPELVAIRDVFEKKYGKDFVSAATDLRPSCGVNRLLIDKLSVRTPTGESKLKILKEIAKEYQIEWDTTETEQELLKPPEELIEGPRSFVSATSFPVTPKPNQSVELNNSTTSSSLPMGGTIGDNNRGGGGGGNKHFVDSASAAKEAAKCANEAIAAANAAAFLANKDPNHASSFDRCKSNSSSINVGYQTTSGASSTDRFIPDGPPSPINSQYTDNQYKRSSETRRYDSHYPSNEETGHNSGARRYVSQSYNGSDSSHYPSNEDTSFNNNNNNNNNMESRKMYRRHSSYNAPSAQSDIKFDQSDSEEEFEEEENQPRGNGSGGGSFGILPPDRLPPPVPSSEMLKQGSPAHSVHPKLPDYDALAARFEALKHHRNSLP